MYKEELEEAFKLLRGAGWEPMLADTPVPYYENGIPAGPPNAMGDDAHEFVMLPKELVEGGIIYTKVRGTSMCGAGIENGDLVQILLTNDFEDGDVVVAWLDGEATLKTFFRDEDDELWLVPQNDMYQPIKVSDFSSVRIVGKVIGVKRDVPRVSYRAIQQQMKSVKKAEKSSEEISDEKLRKAVAKIERQMSSSRQWFCIYRVLVDKGYLEDHDFVGLREKMDELFPSHDFSINPKDLARLDVGPFRKRLFFWEEADAPVQGKRYWEYHTLAKAFQDLL